MKSNLTRRRVGSSEYDLISSEGRVVAHVARTGEYGRDPYPWDWWLAENRESRNGRVNGVTDSLRDAVEQAAIAAGTCSDG